MSPTMLNQFSTLLNNLKIKALHHMDVILQIQYCNEAVRPDYSFVDNIVHNGQIQPENGNLTHLLYNSE